MVKICILEDEIDDARRRYSELSKKHEVDLVLLSTDRMHPFFNDEVELYRQMLAQNFVSEHSIKPKNIFVGEENIPPADVYFCDGLLGRCFGLADRIGKDKTFIYSNDVSINKRAERDGYKLADNIERIIGDLQ